MDVSPGSIIAKILRTDRIHLEKLEARMGRILGRKDVLKNIEIENEEKMRDRLSTLGVSRQAGAKEVYDALISKIESDDNKIFQTLNRPVCSSESDCQSILGFAKTVAKVPRGFFLKREKAAEMLKGEPPRKILEYLGYEGVDAMLQKEKLFEVFSALRFLEDSHWLNETFFKQYETLTPDDFEEREVDVVALSDKWVDATKKFVTKKHHNISHLKELGIVFVIPVNLGISGELLRMLSLIFHYLHEIPFYSDMFRRLAENPSTFASSLISMLRGDVLGERPAENDKAQWLVVQRYLAKDDENDWRLFTPHINPEAMHWARAAGDIARLGNTVPDFEKDLSFWFDLDWVGNYFHDESGVPVLVSFNLVDTVMSLVKERDMVKYLYHHQEALWNKIFTGFFDITILDEMSKRYLLEGYFEV